jgi:hypothetical protein
VSTRTTVPLLWGYDDGGRKAAGFTGQTRDCVTRAIAIATGKPYMEVYQYFMDRYHEDKEKLASGRALKGRRGRRRKPRTPREGVNPVHYKPYIEDVLGWDWTPTMLVGQGCKVHLAKDEIPMEGTLITRLSGHLTTVIDGCMFDTYDPGRDGTRCVYGYWTPSPIARLAATLDPALGQYLDEHDQIRTCRACIPGSRVIRHTCGLRELQDMFSIPARRRR